MSLVPIIIPFYREHEKLRKCKAAIDAQTWRECETFVRDNTHDNILYTAAVNEGLARYCYRDDVKYVLVLNQDAYMQKDCVQRLVSYMDANPQCGIACALQYADTGGKRVVTWGGSWQAFPFGVHRKEPIENYTLPFETYWANGACMMIRVQTIRECGLLDRNLRFICSDSDYSFTARARGWKVFVVPGALCTHSLGASSAASPEIQLVKCRDAAYFAKKWLTGDVYRELAVEGPSLGHIAPRQFIGDMQRDIESLERALGQRPKRPGQLLPRMMWDMGVPPKRPGSF